MHMVNIGSAIEHQSPICAACDLELFALNALQTCMQKHP